VNDEEFESYINSGSVAAKILKEAGTLVKPGESYLEFVITIENLVAEEGMGLAFPLNVSINEDAAHDTASINDDRVFLPCDVVKVDLGVHLNGFIADTATTIDLGNNGSLLKASEEALESAIRSVRPGINVGKIGAAIQSAIGKYGYKPISNLTGHGLGRFSVHNPPSIPNISHPGGPVLEEGMIFAIEPFATTGTGIVSEKSRCEIFSQIRERPVRHPNARKVMDEIKERKGLPFCRRAIQYNKADLGLAALMRERVIRGYPVLSDAPGSLVSQHEHTLIVTSDGCIVTTR